MAMPGKRVQFNDETWAAIDALARERGMSFQDLREEAFADLLKKQSPAGRTEGGAEESVSGRDKTR
jgi:hypothetical protein